MGGARDRKARDPGHDGDERQVAAPPQRRDHSQVLFLQRTSGNRAVAGLLRQEAGPQDGAGAGAAGDPVLAAVTAPLQQAGQELLADDPVAGEGVRPVLQAVVEQLSRPAEPSAAPAAMPETAPVGVARSPLLRQAAATAAGPAEQLSVDQLRKLLVDLTELVVTKIGNRPYSGPRGGEKDPVRWAALYCDWLHTLCSPLLTKPFPGVDPKYEKAVQQELRLLLKRLALMRGFYNSLLPAPVFHNRKPAEPKQEEGAMPAQNRPDDPRRIQVVAGALADVGKVRAKEKDSDGRRIGYQHLKSIFHTAWPKFGNDALLEKPIAGKRLRPGAKKDPETDEYRPEDFEATDDALVSWCGVGATYWYKKVDSSFPDWVMSAGVSGQLNRRPLGELPQVGDLLIGPMPLNHHAVITWVDPAAKPPKSQQELGAIKIKTVESNMNGGQIVETPAGHDSIQWALNGPGIFDPFSRKEPKKK